MPRPRAAAVAGAIMSVGIVYFVLLKATTRSQEGDFFDSPSFWWGWLVLPATAAGAAWKRYGGRSVLGLAPGSSAGSGGRGGRRVASRPSPRCFVLAPWGCSLLRSSGYSLRERRASAVQREDGTHRCSRVASNGGCRRLGVDGDEHRTLLRAGLPRRRAVNRCAAAVSRGASVVTGRVLRTGVTVDLPRGARSRPALLGGAEFLRRAAGIVGLADPLVMSRASLR